MPLLSMQEWHWYWCSESECRHSRRPSTFISVWTGPASMPMEESPEKTQFPSETQINCDRQSKTCIAATAEYSSGHPHVSIEYFQLLKWDVDGIIATSNDAVCMQRTLLISFPNKAISISGMLKGLPKEKQKHAKQSVRVSPIRRICSQEFAGVEQGPLRREQGQMNANIFSPTQANPLDSPDGSLRWLEWATHNNEELNRLITLFSQ